MSLGEGDVLTGGGGDVGLEAQGAAGDSTLCRAGEGEARGAEDEQRGQSQRIQGPGRDQ